jgi:hypothetical protein
MKTFVLTEWETRRPYLATVCRECQLWKSAPDAAFESSACRWLPWAGKKGHSPARDAWKTALFGGKNRYTLNGLLRPVCGIAAGGLANCAASVEPASAVVDEFPLVITCDTMSK